MIIARCVSQPDVAAPFAGDRLTERQPFTVSLKRRFGTAEYECSCDDMCLRIVDNKAIFRARTGVKCDRNDESAPPHWAGMRAGQNVSK